MEDVRYSELVFLQKLASGSRDFEFFMANGEQAKAVGLSGNMYVDMAVTLLEEMHIRFRAQHLDALVSRLRGDLPINAGRPGQIFDYEWVSPRAAIYNRLIGQNLCELSITYRGLRRIEELREVLRRDRILEHFGVLLDLRYVHTDLQDCLRRSPETATSVLYADLDKFKPINDKFGHDAGDVVLKAYLEVVRDSLESFGKAYRGRGDEVVAIIAGQSHDFAVRLAEKIRKSVEAMQCELSGKQLPSVTTSIGVASAPPESPTMELQSIAETRNRKAKETGRNRVVHSAVK